MIIYKFFTDYFNSYDYLIVGDFGLENLHYPALHLWNSHRGWHVQFYRYEDPKKLVNKEQRKTLKTISDISDVSRDVYIKIFNMVFKSDDYEEFKEYCMSNEITVDETCLLN